MNDYINYYDLLSIDKNASSEDIKKAYRNLAKKWHPDLNKDPKAPEMAKKINEAKEVLLDETKRKEYDIYLDNYKNDIYDNLDKKNKEDKVYTYNNTYDSKYDNKTYTKWEYFKLYLKYYNVSVFRKILATIFVALESIFCTILDLVNYIIALLLAFFGYYLAFILIIVGTIFILLVVSKYIIVTNLPPRTNSEGLIMSFGGIICIATSVFIKDFYILLATRVPVLISKLNLFLFKISIGYKK